MTVARRWAAKIEEVIELGEYVDPRSVEDLTVGELLDRYKDEVVSEKSQSTQGPEGSMIKLLKADLGDTQYGDFDTPFIVSYFIELSKRISERTGNRLSACTLKKRLKILGLMEKAVANRWNVPMPNGSVVLAAKERIAHTGILDGADVEREFALEDGEYEKIRNYKPRKANLYKYAALFLIETGMRRSEMFDMEKARIDWGNGLYDLEKQKTDRTRKRARKGRLVPLTQRAMAILRLVIWANRKKDIGDRVWHWKHIDTISNGMTKLKNKLEIKEFSAHALRHEFGSHHTNKSVDFRIVAAAMGHADLKSQKRYSHPSMKKTRSQFERD